MFRQNSQNSFSKQMVSATTMPVQQYDSASTMLALGTSHQPTAVPTGLF